VTVGTDGGVIVVRVGTVVGMIVVTVVGMMCVAHLIKGLRLSSPKDRY
jgi:hypothetical protein